MALIIYKGIWSLTFENIVAAHHHFKMYLRPVYVLEWSGLCELFADEVSLF